MKRNYILAGVSMLVGLILMIGLMAYAVWQNNQPQMFYTFDNGNAVGLYYEGFTAQGQKVYKGEDGVYYIFDTEGNLSQTLDLHETK